jgi:hypothetical protein
MVRARAAGRAETASLRPLFGKIAQYANMIWQNHG